MTNTFIVYKIFNKCQTFSGTHFPSSGQNRQNKCLKCTESLVIHTFYRQNKCLKCTECTEMYRIFSYSHILFNY